MGSPMLTMRRKCRVLQAMRVQCEQEKKEVLDAGGLVIIGSERHESRRIDNQLVAVLVDKVTPVHLILRFTRRRPHAYLRW